MHGSGVFVSSIIEDSWNFGDSLRQKIGVRNIYSLWLISLNSLIN